MSDRQLGLGMATALVVGNTIGMGIFMQPAALAPFGLNALTGWAAVIIGCVCLALTFAALARKLPQADGPFGYVRSTLGETLAFPALWSYWISCWVTLPVLAIGTVGYFLNVFPAARSIPPAVIAVSFMWIFVGVNLLGIRSGGRVQVVTSLLKIVPLILIMVVGSFSILSNPGEYTPNLPTTPLTMQLSMGAAAVALYAMLGFESAAVAAGRVKDPERTIPRATLIGTLIVAAFYVAIVAIGLLVVPQATLATSDAPAVTIVDHLLGPGNGRWISLFVVISGLGCLNGWTLLSSELTRTLAANRLLPPVLGDSNRFGAPWASLLLAGALATFVGLMNYSAYTRRRIHQAVADRVGCEPAALRLLLARALRDAAPEPRGPLAPALDRRRRWRRLRRFRLLRRRLGSVHLGARARPCRCADLLLDAWSPEARHRIRFTDGRRCASRASAGHRSRACPRARRSPAPTGSILPR